MAPKKDAWKDKVLVLTEEEWMAFEDAFEVLADAEQMALEHPDSGPPPFSEPETGAGLLELLKASQKTGLRMRPLEAQGGGTDMSQGEAVLVPVAHAHDLGPLFGLSMKLQYAPDSWVKALFRRGFELDHREQDNTYHVRLRRPGRRPYR
jgi:hypothetical protein